ncbi:PIN2/TERF1-interacting telomerase inhibitor 1 [Geranomyces variabilis]|nr:PIN2/TERF1-interacting telomerase inhibitor 1 [Geranomyces variabilis]
MGLAGPRTKQRIGLDPQNRAWKDDKSKFGLKMMQKMGWTEGKGLGINEDGQKEHVKVRLKENNLGLGADRRTIDNWLDNNSAFDALLKGMAGNEDVAAGATTTTTTTTETVVEQTEVAAAPAPAAVSGRLYHRQKFRRNKAVSGFNAEQLSMILGVKHTPTAAPDEPSPEAESPSEAVQDHPLLKVAGTTVQDYFAQKMAARGLAPPVATKSAAEEEDDEDDYDAPPSFGGLGLGASSQPATAAPPAHYMSSVGFTMGGPGLSSFIKTVDVSVTETLMQATTTPTANDDEPSASSSTPTKASEKAEKRARKEQARAEKARRKQKRAEKRALKAASSKLPTPADSPSQKPAEPVPEPIEEPLAAPAVKHTKKSKKEKAVAEKASSEQLNSGKKRRREENEDAKPKSKKEKKEKTEKKEKAEKEEKARKRAKAKRVEA